MSKNNHLSQLDPNQIVKKLYDEENDAQRVIFVGGENISIHSDNSIMEQKLNELVLLQQKNSKNPEIHNVFIDRIKEVQVPTFIKETEYKTIEIPVIQKEIEYRTVEVPIVVKEFEIIEKPVIVYKDSGSSQSLPMFIKICMIMQVIALIGNMVVNLIKH